MTAMAGLKKTPLYEWHVENKGKMVDFEGWWLPVQYKGIRSEHEAVRKNAGIFDVSHMGEIEINGKDATSYLQCLVTIDVEKMKNGQIKYAFLCYEDGGIIDDILIYKSNREKYLLVVNASNIQNDYRWISNKTHGYQLEINNRSDDFGQIALQGPYASEIMRKIMGENFLEIPFFHFKENLFLDGAKCLISRTGYTGEDGFEIYTSTEDLEKLWKRLIELGAPYKIEACGLGARDTLRFEAGLPLYGNEIEEEITPLEADLEQFVDLDKKFFIGIEALKYEWEKRPKRKLVGMELKEKGIARNGYEILSTEDQVIGYVTTGYIVPGTEKNLAMGIIYINYSNLGTRVKIKIRKKLILAEIRDKHFYSKKYKK